MSFSEKHLEDLSKRIEQVSEENQNLRQQLTQLQAEYQVDQDNRDYVRENYQEKVEELKSETLLTTVLKEKLYSEEMDVKQLQDNLAVTVRGKKNFMDLRKSPHGHNKKVDPKKPGRDSSRRDVSVPVLIRTIRRLTKEKVQMASEVSSMLRNQVAERASAKEEANILHAELDSWTRRLETEKNEKKVKELKSETLLTTVLREKLYSEEMDIKQLQTNLAATVRGIDILKCEVQNAQDALSYATPKLKYLELQVLKKDENINQLTNDLQECMKELGIVKAILPKVFQERDFMWEKVKSYSEMNMLLNYEINMLKRKVDTLDEDFLMKEGQIKILKDSIGKPFDLLATKESNWLGATTSAAVIILDWNLGACLYGFKLLKSRVVVLFVAGTSRVFLICFGVHYWYFGHCISYAVVASVLLGAAVSRNLLVTDPLAARRDALQSTVIRLREGFRRKDQNSSASSSEGCGSSVKRSSSADAGHLGNATVPCTGDGSTWNNIEGINSDKSIDSGRPSLALRSSSCRSVVQEPEVGSSYVDRNLEHNSSLVVCSSSGLESQGGDSSTSTSAYHQILDLNLALAFQEKLNDPRITSMLKRKGRHTDRELGNLLQDKGLDPNFAVMLKKNGLDPMILALLQRSSLDADREHRESNRPVTESNDVEDVLPNHISFLEELRLQGLGKWLQRCRVMLHHVAGTPERAWLLFSLIFILETAVVAIFQPKTIKLFNATRQ
ncbi:Calpain-type cysteine protease DEK1 [Capsicum chinense]|nr:Calpain-type cysteine protease DEK1 [Capsicum chinense]